MQYKESGIDMYDLAYPMTYGTSFYNSTKHFEKKLKFLADILKVVGTDNNTIQSSLKYFRDGMKKFDLLKVNSIDDYINNIGLKILLK